MGADRDPGRLGVRAARTPARRRNRARDRPDRGRDRPGNRYRTPVLRRQDGDGTLLFRRGGRDRAGGAFARHRGRERDRGGPSGLAHRRLERRSRRRLGRRCRDVRVLFGRRQQQLRRDSAGGARRPRRNLGGQVRPCDRVVERRAVHRLREPELGLRRNHRAIQRGGAPGQFRRHHRRPGAGGVERKDRLRLGRRQRPIAALRGGQLHRPRRPLRERNRECPLGGGPGGARGADTRAARPCDRRRGRGPRRRRRLRDRPVLQSLRHRRRVVHRRARRARPDGLFRAESRRPRPGRPGCAVRGRNVLRRADGDGRAGAVEVAFPQPASQHGAGLAADGDGEQDRHLRRPLHLRRGADGSRAPRPRRSARPGSRSARASTARAASSRARASRPAVRSGTGSHRHSPGTRSQPSTRWARRSGCRSPPSPAPPPVPRRRRGWGSSWRRGASGSPPR